ncbi:MAG: tyrosine-type recombinase/integrase [bacterium]
MSVYQSKSGTWFYRFKVKGKSYHKSIPLATCKREAEIAETRIKSDLFQGKFDLIESVGEYPFNSLVKEFEKYGEANRKGWNKADKYEVEHLKNFFLNKKLNEITPFFIEKYRINRKAQGRKPATINRDITILSRMFAMAINEGLINENPCSAKKVKPLKVDNQIERYLTVTEERELFRHLEDYLKPIITILLHTGMRKGECLKLKWQDSVDLKKRMFTLYETKNGKIRKIPMSDTVYNSLKEHSKDGEYVFTNPMTGEPYNDIKRAFTRACNDAGIEKLRIHDLRHTAATRMVSAGIDLVVVASILGHSDIRITASRYAHPLPENKIKAIQSLDNFVSQSGLRIAQ